MMKWDFPLFKRSEQILQYARDSK